jgi:hypothetical protein
MFTPPRNLRRGAYRGLSHTPFEQLHPATTVVGCYSSARKLSRRFPWAMIVEQNPTGTTRQNLTAIGFKGPYIDAQSLLELSANVSGGQVSIGDNQGPSYWYDQSGRRNHLGGGAEIAASLITNSGAFEKTITTAGGVILPALPVGNTAPLNGGSGTSVFLSVPFNTTLNGGQVQALFGSRRFWAFGVFFKVSGTGDTFGQMMTIQYNGESPGTTTTSTVLASMDNSTTTAIGSQHNSTFYSTTWTTGTWHIVGAVYNGSTVNFWLDGAIKATGSVSDAVGANVANVLNFCVGGRLGGAPNSSSVTSPFGGYVAEVWFGTAISNRDIYALQDNVAAFYGLP